MCVCQTLLGRRRATMAATMITSPCVDGWAWFQGRQGHCRGRFRVREVNLGHARRADYGETLRCRFVTGYVQLVEVAVERGNRQIFLGGNRRKECVGEPDIGRSEER